jgi:CheY-like chemotaxis protein
MTGPGCAAAFRVWEREQGLDARFGRLPIVALSANVLEVRLSVVSRNRLHSPPALQEHVNECKEAGMSSFLSKPLRSDAMGMLTALAAENAQAMASKGGEA